MAKRERIRWRNHLVNLVTVTAGVFAAFQANRFQEARSIRQQFNTQLATLRTALARDLAAIQSDAQILRERTAVCKRLADPGSRRKLWGRDTLSAFYRTLLVQPTFKRNEHAYRALTETASLAVLLDSTLNHKLADVYDGAYATIEGHVLYAHQYFQIAIRNRQFGGGVSEAVVKTSSFQTMLIMYADWDRSTLEAYTVADRQVQDLLLLLNQSFL